MQYTINCEVVGRGGVAFRDVFSDWHEARSHLESLFIAYYDDLVAQSPLSDPLTAPVIEEIRAWRPGTFRSVAVLDGPRFFLYPVVDSMGVARLACPRCQGELIATASVHGVVGDSPASLMTRADGTYTVRVSCKGGCDAESDECEDVFDALDGFYLAATWETSGRPFLSLAGLVPQAADYRLDLECGHEPRYVTRSAGRAGAAFTGAFVCNVCDALRNVTSCTEVPVVPLVHARNRLTLPV